MAPTSWSWLVVQAHGSLPYHDRRLKGDGRFIVRELLDVAGCRAPYVNIRGFVGT
jgi:hypothetical protein